MDLQMLMALLMALGLTHQVSTDVVRLDVSPKIYAECGRQVVLHCNASSTVRGLSVKHMAWFLNRSPLCTMDGHGEVHHHHRSLHFQCKHSHGHLRLVFPQMTPLLSGESNQYACKLRSNHGTESRNTTVQLQECCGAADEVLTASSHTCTFRQVSSDSDVRWFQDSVLTNHSDISTTKQVDEHGWVTVNESRKLKSSDEAYNCSLISASTGQPISCTVQTFTLKEPNYGEQISGSQRLVGTFLLCVYSLCFLLLN